VLSTLKKIAGDAYQQPRNRNEAANEHQPRNQPKPTYDSFMCSQPVEHGSYRKIQQGRHGNMENAEKKSEKDDR
jgi:hypothetical protein